MKLRKIAEWLEQTVDETLIYYGFPDEHWRRIRTNNLLERIMREIRGRTCLVRHITRRPRPSGRSLREPLNLAAARLRHIAGTKWSLTRYMNMRSLMIALPDQPPTPTKSAKDFGHYPDRKEPD